MILRTIHKLRWQSFGPSHWELCGTMGAVSISYIDNGEWILFLDNFDDQGRCTELFTSRDDAAAFVAQGLLQ